MNTEKSEDTEIFIDKDERAQMEISILKKLNAKLELEIIDESVKALHFQIQNLKSALKETQQSKTIKFERYKRASAKHQELTDSIAEAHGIDKPNWGFDPDSGKIIL